VARIGLLFPGSMGAEIGTAARGEVLWTSEGRSAATAERAAAAGFRDARTLAALVAESDAVLSICPPAIAEDVAAAVAAEGFDRLYVEANAIAPARAERIAADLRKGGMRVVDGSIIARSGLNLYLSGAAEDIARVEELFAETAVTTIRLEGGIGAASALKMAFGGWNKIGIALAAQAYAIARAYGVEEQLAREGVDGDRVLGAGARAWRWAPEMNEVADTCAALGLPDGLGRGAAAVFDRWAAHRNRPADLAELLDELLH
jgi:3-hydroxyisobutyrate dehydrogenase-like beta-hydroxyacid dehydrogenase